VVFFKTVAPVEPVSFVKKVCEDAMNNASHKRTRFTKRLSPVSLMGRASVDGLEKVAAEVLPPHFHQETSQPRKV
jgi:tRNA acetyltransferase TAN1